MSAETLRRAAALMRRRAGAATQSEWYANFAPDHKGSLEGEWIVDSEPTFICSTHIDDDRGLADAEHIASWHPTVALAVADLLDAEADDIDRAKAEALPGLAGFFDAYPDERFLAVAAAYLGETP